jgi:hypothetical protein
MARAAVWIVPGSFGWGSAVFAATATFAPSRAARNAIASPMPRLAPVMKSVRLRSDMSWLPRPGVRRPCGIMPRAASPRDRMRAGLPLDILAGAIVVFVATIVAPRLGYAHRSHQGRARRVATRPRLVRGVPESRPDTTTMTGTVSA